jgi:hypothetical protein
MKKYLNLTDTGHIVKRPCFGAFVSLDVFQHFAQFLRNQSKPDIRQALRNALCVSDER